VCQTLKNPGLAWEVGMEPSGFEPLTPCMAWSLFISVNPMHCRGFASLLHYVLRQTLSQDRWKLLVVKQELDGRRKGPPKFDISSIV